MHSLTKTDFLWIFKFRRDLVYIVQNIKNYEYVFKHCIKSGLNFLYFFLSTMPIFFGTFIISFLYGNAWNLEILPIKWQRRIALCFPFSFDTPSNWQNMQFLLPFFKKSFYLSENRELYSISYNQKRIFSNSYSFGYKNNLMIW